MAIQIITCGDCGKVDTRPERFSKHAPCNPEDATVWVSFGSGGQRATNRPDDIASLAREMFGRFPKISSVSVHHGRCDLGRTTPRGCTCYPTAVLRPSHPAT